MNNSSHAPRDQRGQGGRHTQRAPQTYHRSHRRARRETPEDRLMAAIGGDSSPREERQAGKTKMSHTSTSHATSSNHRPHDAPRNNSRHFSPKSTQKRKRGQYIHPSKFVNRAVAPAEEAPYRPQYVFDDFPLDPRLHATIAAKGYLTPSAIQDQAIIPVLEGRDVLGLANTGTGKTAAFVIPTIQKLLAGRVSSGQSGRPGLTRDHDESGRLSVLIITPTRELAAQIDDEFRAFAQNMRLYSAVVVGGVNINRQIQAVRRRPHVIIGTPGRLKELLQQQVLTLSHVHTLVLDEADRMCDMGFLPDITRIISHVPPTRQNLFFSATMTDQIAGLIRDMMHDPVTISVVKGTTSDHVEQSTVGARDKPHKIELLTNMLSNQEFERVLVFSETKYGAQRLARTLESSGFTADAIHGNKSQPQRQRALDKFKSGETKILVATDVAARGLDIPHVSHVINFDQPHTYDDYVHRIGRTGRAGNRGHAITFIDE